jgi:predicted CoA-binding protein
MARINDPAEIAAALESARTIAVVGCSPHSYRPSNSISRYLISAGYEVIPVNPGHRELLGRPCYRSLEEIPAGVLVDIVDVFRRSEYVAELADAALRRGGVKLFWMQDGVADARAARRLAEAGIGVAMDRCIYRDREAIRRGYPIE